MMLFVSDPKITLIECNMEAIKNATKYNYSNCLTEEFNNKTKVIKHECMEDVALICYVLKYWLKQLT